MLLLFFPQTGATHKHFCPSRSITRFVLWNHQLVPTFECKLLDSGFQDFCLHLFHELRGARSPIIKIILPKKTRSWIMSGRMQRSHPWRDHPLPFRTAKHWPKGEKIDNCKPLNLPQSKTIWAMQLQKQVPVELALAEQWGRPATTQGLTSCQNEAWTSWGFCLQSGDVTCPWFWRRVLWARSLEGCALHIIALRFSPIYGIPRQSATSLLEWKAHCHVTCLPSSHHRRSNHSHPERHGQSIAKSNES